MNKKALFVLAALGVTQAKESLANDFGVNSGVTTSDPSVVAESFHVNLDTVRTLKMFSDMGALQFNNVDGSVFVDPTNLPNALIEKLHESNEVVFNEDADLFVLTDSFMNTLASQHTFSRLGTVPSITANQEILKRLKERTTPIRRDDLILYSRSSFIR